jgi:hypothetical protein
VPSPIQSPCNIETYILTNSQSQAHTQNITKFAKLTSIASIFSYEKWYPFDKASTNNKLIHTLISCLAAPAQHAKALNVLSSEGREDRLTYCFHGIPHNCFVHTY